MKKIGWILGILLGHCLPASAQVAWRDSTLSFSEIEWDNYSSSYLGDGNNRAPFLVCAIPYNGIYEFGADGSDRTALDMTFSGSAFRFRSNLEHGQQILHTYDSAAVYFLAPGVFPSNAARYEFQVLENNERVVKPWSTITAFADPNFQLNTFRGGFGFLGGFTSSWGNYLVVELRKKGQQQPFARTIVQWQQVRPVLRSILTMRELNERLLRLKKPFDLSFDANEQKKWKKEYPADQLDSLTGLPKKLILSPGETELLFFLDATIYRKEALEYRLSKDGRVQTPWKPNDVDNNFIWLRKLGPGAYTLEMRYRKQRHHTSVYSFEIKPAWFETGLFKLGIGVLTAAFFGCLILLFKLRRQQQKTAAEQAEQEKFAMRLKSIQAQLNPHFVFNALSSIQGLINKNDLAGANRYLSTFGSLLRNSLRDSGRPFIPLENELHTLETYLSLEQLRFHFSYSIQIQESLPIAELELPSLFLQPLVENAVKHGISSMQEKGRIVIGLQQSDNNLVIQIRDNGPGFTPGTQQEGFGLKLTADRIQLLNQRSKERPIEMKIESRPGAGASIDLIFKNWLL